MYLSRSSEEDSDYEEDPSRRHSVWSPGCEEEPLDVDCSITERYAFLRNIILSSLLAEMLSGWLSPLLVYIYIDLFHVALFIKVKINIHTI